MRTSAKVEVLKLLESGDYLEALKLALESNQKPYDGFTVYAVITNRNTNKSRFLLMDSGLCQESVSRHRLALESIGYDMLAIPDRLARFFKLV